MLEFNYEQCPSMTDSLVARFKWASRMRFSAALAIVAMLFLTKFTGWTGFPALPLAAVGLMEMFVNQPYPLYVRNVKNPEIVLFIQQFVDIVLITMGVHILGGMNAFYMILIYPMVITFTGVVVSRVYTFVIANLSFVFYAGLVYLEYTGLIPNYPVHHVELPGGERAVLTLLILPFYNLIAFFSTYLAAQLRQREQQLMATKVMLTQAGKLATRRAQAMAGKDIAQKIHPSLSLVGDRVRSLLAEMKEDDSMYEAMHMMEAEFSRLSNLIKDTIALATDDLEKKPGGLKRALSIHSAIDEAVELLSTQMRKGGIVLYREYDPALPQIKGDPEQLRQVFFNLLNFLRSSFAFRQVGKIWIRTRTLRTRDSRESVVEVAFRHDGPALSEEDLGRLFTSPTPSTVGGIGLSISYGIVQAHQGRLWAESPDNGGLAFFLTFPTSEMSLFDE